VSLARLTVFLIRTSSLAALLLLGSLRAADPPGADDWKYDLVYPKNGRPPLKGLVTEQSATQVLIKCVSRKPGSPTVVIPEWLPRAEVERVELLEPQERDQLRQRLQALARERETLATRLKALDPAARTEDSSGDVLDLREVPWVRDPKTKALAYESAHFRLISNARPAVVQLAAIHLEQIYVAYVRALPPRVAKARPTTIVLTGSLAEYQALLREQGRDLLNPAIFDPQHNQITCGSDLDRLGDELERVRRQHEKLRADLKEREADLTQAYKGKPPPELLTPIHEARKKIKTTEERNDKAFRQARRRLFQRLYHEAFHAYLANFVYPPAEGEVPRWLNEGLAQIFETAIVEVGELRVGHADKTRLTAVRAALAKDSLPPLTELLRSGPKQFVVAHRSDAAAADRYYLASWALAFHLTFEKKVLGTKALDEYVQALHRGTDPLVAFRGLVGQSVPEFEKGFQEYLKHLRPDGTSRRPGTKEFRR
jgi:hypothetical protein